MCVGSAAVGTVVRTVLSNIPATDSLNDASIAVALRDIDESLFYGEVNLSNGRNVAKPMYATQV